MNAPVSLYHQKWIRLHELADDLLAGYDGLYSGLRVYLQKHFNSLCAEKSTQDAYNWLKSFDERASRVFGKIPFMGEQLKIEFGRKCESSSVESAVVWLDHFEENFLKTPVFGLTVASDAKDIKDASSARATKCKRLFQREIGSMQERGTSEARRYKTALNLVVMTCENSGVSTPSCIQKKNIEQEDIISAMARLCNERWWRRQLRVLVGRYCENAARHLGMVCKRRGGYCSILALMNRHIQKKSNRNLLEKLRAENDLGESFTLAELSDMGLSNPVNRRAELMTRISGFEQLADEDIETDWQAVFYTLTCPSKFHSHNRAGKPNSKWTGQTPRDAQEHLCHVWEKTRASWEKKGFRVFGFRVSEPHHDGCPHWHLLLWMPRSQIEQINSIFKAYALEVDGDEHGADKRRFRVDLIDRKDGSATGYIAKYISKNVDGLKDNGEAWGSDSVKTAMRTEAWAGTWGIRQFQQIGGASVTVWRLLRGMEAEGCPTADIEAIRKVCDEGDWSEFTRLMGGATVKRRDQPLRAMYAGDLLTTVKAKVNEYEEKIRRLIGVMVVEKLLPIQTRFREWVVSPILSDQVFFPVGQAPPARLGLVSITVPI